MLAQTTKFYMVTLLMVVLFLGSSCTKAAPARNNESRTGRSELRELVTEFKRTLQEKKDTASAEDLARARELERESRTAVREGRVDEATSLLKEAIEILGGSSQPSVTTKVKEPSGKTSTQKKGTAQTGEQDSPFGIMTAFGLDNPSFVRNMGFSNDTFVKWAGDHFKYLGAKWSRAAGERIIWGLIEPELGKGHDWSNSDLVLKRLYENAGDNFSLIVMITHTRRGSSSYDVIESEEEHFKDFVKAAVERYDGDGTNDFDSNIKVKYWQVSNEIFPRSWFRYGGTVDGYNRVLELTYNGVKEADPEAKVILGAQVMIKNPKTKEIDLSKFKESISKLNGKRLFDYVDLHYWGAVTDYEIPRVDEIRGFLDSEGYSDVKLCALEHGTFINQPKGFRKQSERDQANYLVRSFVYNLANGFSIINWSNLAERPSWAGSSSTIYNYMGLISDGQNQETMDTLGVPRLSYYSYKLLIEKLDGADWNKIETVTDGKDNIYVFKFIKGKKPIWVAWWDYFDDKNDKEGNRKTATLKVNSEKVTITSAIADAESGDKLTQQVTFGNEIQEVSSGSASIALGTDPVYIMEGEIGAPTYKVMATPTEGRQPKIRERVPRPSRERRRKKR